MNLQHLFDLECHRPLAVLAVRDGHERAQLAPALEAGIGLIEVRIDEFGECGISVVRSYLESFSGLPLLGTIRAAREGGGWKDSEAARLALYEAIIPHVDLIDIELSATEILDEVVELAHAAGRRVIGSYHDFEATPEDGRLEALLAGAAQCQADLFKVAAKCNTPGDLRRLAAFTACHSGEFPLAVMGMGPYGALSRIFFGALGSRLTYTFLGRPTAPGQIACDETLALLSRFYPAG
ncbi:MAG: type I 3-dehydroquinate dehydratase [Candidatus Hydrogenedentes bacterium]|nr:type I 3-dehydroquinate dehydratase [Candidatus Hydrogenedentota bacterium]